MFFKKTILFLSLTISLVIVFGAGYLYLSYELDPLHLYHKNNSNRYCLHPNMRIQAAGIINSFEFDSIILGTSVLENLSSADCNKQLGGKFVNISISGGTFIDRSIILEYLIKNKKINKIIYSLDRDYLYCSSEKLYPAESWQFLYDDSKLNDILAYCNQSMFKNIIFNRKIGEYVSTDRPNAWFNNKSLSCRFGGLQNWINNRDKKVLNDFLYRKVPDAASRITNNNLILNKVNIEDSKSYTYNNILKFAEKYNDIEFYFIFPPYWRYDYAEMLQVRPNVFALHQDIIRYVVNESKKYKNIKVYGFEDCDFVDNIDNYKDVTHFTPEINLYILNSISKNRNVLTSENVEEYLEKCRDLARNFDIIKLNNDIIKMIKK